jgi:Protein of unknown function (DUF4127)
LEFDVHGEGFIMNFALLMAILVTFVPMYATPTAAQLPVMAGRIAGVRVVEPPLRMLGDYIAPGDRFGIGQWLLNKPARDAQAFVISSDMLAYGGLDASRVPAVTLAQSLAGLQVLKRLRMTHPGAWIGVFGTIMRLEPTSVTRVGEAADYWQIAQYPTWEYIWEYAQLPDPPSASERARAEHLRSLIGAPVLQQYLDTRARDRVVDLAQVSLAADGIIDRLVLGQDDAGPVGLHVADVHALQDRVAQLRASSRVSIEPGADELGLALVAHALARSVHWTPRVAVVYSRPGGGQTQDPLEYAPIDQTIGALITLCGGIRDDAHSDLTLFVRVPRTGAAQDDQLLRAMQSSVYAGRSVALVDLTSLTYSYDAQALFVRKLIDAGIAATIDAYSSWNTDANSVGIALGEAIAVGTGRRAATYDPLAHAEFMLDRYIDDYLYHTRVRPQINAELASQGVAEHYWLDAQTAARVNARVRDLITPLANDLVKRVYPRYRARVLTIALPWPRTAEIRSEIKLRPSGPLSSTTTSEVGRVLRRDRNTP